jgi:toxin CcdB
MPKQFDVFRNPYAQSAKQMPYLMVIQHHAFEALSTTVVIPLRDRKLPPEPRFNPSFEIEGKFYVLMPELMAAMDKKPLKQHIGNLNMYQLEIKQAVDILLGGV